MTGIFDSGVGGLSALEKLRELMPREDIVYLADRENAPYGTKNEAELIGLVTNDIKRLRLAGADRILAACCTASTVYPKLTRDMQIGVIPIIEPTARAALAASDSEKIAVMATERTVASHAFRDTLIRLSCGKARVTELAAQPLVALVEGGARDGLLSDSARREIEELLSPLYRSGCDVLILGCTHFSHLSGEISKLFKDMKIIDSAHEGALSLSNKNRRGGGRTLYL